MTNSVLLDWMPVIIGVFLIVFGILNLLGDLRSIHWYHRQRVSPEDQKKYGRWFGSGSVTIGVGILLFGVLSLCSADGQAAVWTIIGSVFLTVSLVIGLGLMVYAMIRYNRGIF